MPITDLTIANFEATVGGTTNLVVIDFWASWCGPCMKQGPIIDELSEEIENVCFCKVNCDEQPDIAGAFNVTSIPTLMFIKNAQVLNVLVGLTDKDSLKRIIEHYKTK